MTARSSTTASGNRAIVAPGLIGRTRRAFQDTNSVLWRDTIRTMRQPDLLLFAVIMGVFFLVLFNYVFGGSIGAGADIDYLHFLVPGVFVITALQGAQQTSLGLAADGRANRGRAASGGRWRRRQAILQTLSFPLAQAFGVLPVVGATGQFRTCPGQVRTSRL